MMKKIWILVLVLMMLLTGCGDGGRGDEPVVTKPAEVPEVTVGEILVAPDTEVLDVSGKNVTLENMLNAAPELKCVNTINLGLTELTAGELTQLQNAYPNARIDYIVSVCGQELTAESEYLDARAMDAEETENMIEKLPLLPGLKEINFIREDGSCVYGTADVELLNQLREVLPEVYFRVSFDLFGKYVTSEDQRIEYYRTEIGNEGVETIRAVLPYLRSCIYLVLDGCGVDNEVMAQLRDDFPDVKVVWRIWLVEEDYNSKLYLRCGSYLTDTIRIRTTYVNDENSHLLNYCTDTRYVDVGHVWQLSQCEFLSYMPDLEVCIIAITYITDITPLANHDKLEYLELFTSDIEDLTPLMTCPNLEHLNIANMKKLKDISPLYGLTKLKRLRMVSSPGIPESQKQEIARLLPDCTILNMGIFPTSWFWRTEGGTKTKVPRYELLCEQMEYSIDAWEYGIP